MQSDGDLEVMAKRLGIPLISIVTKDHLPKHKLQGAYIINLQDDLQGSGTHWTAAILYKNKCLYFDPFGLTAPSELQLWFGRPYIYNGMQIQDVKSGYCGTYCIFYLKFFYQNKHLPINEILKKFMALWSKNPKDNLQRLKMYIKDSLEDGNFDNK